MRPAQRPTLTWPPSLTLRRVSASGTAAARSESASRNGCVSFVLEALGARAAKVHMGREAETEGHIVEAFRLSPRDTLARQWMDSMGTAKIHLGADAEAIDWLRRSIQANPNYSTAHFAFRMEYLRHRELNLASR